MPTEWEIAQGTEALEEVAKRAATKSVADGITNATEEIKPTEEKARPEDTNDNAKFTNNVNVDANANDSGGGAGPRTLVLCFDGTAGEYDAANTNVVKLFALLKKDPHTQLCYYQPGVGTWFHPGVVSPLFELAAKALDLMFAWYIGEHVLDGYRFLMQNYKAGDRICLFGFSRGAYTARALAGFLHSIGLLPRDNDCQIPFAYKLYKKYDKTDAASVALCRGFRNTFCQTVGVEFLGAWDTVSSVGVVMKRTLPFASSNSSIRTFRHALSLDERRARFQPNPYHRPVPAPGGGVDGKATAAVSNTEPPSGFFARLFSAMRAPRAVVADLDEDTDSVPDDVLEVWFSGCHGDVGGGDVPDGTAHSLSDITLRWMVRQVVEAACGVEFDEAGLASLMSSTPPGEDLDADGAAEGESSDEKEKIDALAPMHDMLKGNLLERMWWIVEWLWLSFAWQDAGGVWHEEHRRNKGRGRTIYDDHPNFHVTVQRRMQSALGYAPNASWTAGSQNYVV